MQKKGMHVGLLKETRMLEFTLRSAQMKTS